MKPKSLILLGVSGAFGLIAAALLTKAIGQNKNQNAEVQTRTVLVATDDLAIHAKLNEENTRLEKWPANIMPPGVSTNLEQIANKRLNVRVAKGAPIFVRDLVDEHAPQTLPIPRGKNIVGIKVPSEDHISGLLQPGHEVDVIGIFKSRDQPSFSRTFLRGIKVFSVNNRTNPDMKEETKADQSDITVSLIVSEKQAEKLALVQGAGNSKIKLAIRGLDDDSNIDAPTDRDEDMVTMNDVANSGRNNGNSKLGLGSIWGDFSKMVAAAPKNSSPVSTSAKPYEPFKVKVINGDVVTEYILRDGSLPQINATSVQPGSPVGSFVQPPSDEGRGRTLESLAGEVETSSDDGNLEF